MDSNFWFLVARPSNRHGRRDYCPEKRKPICWGTEGSNPAPSTSESRANLTSLPSLQGLCAAAYWTPITGAHEVRGAIRDRWVALGWERGSLGYPVSDETNEVDGCGRLSLFEHGAIPPA